MADLPQQNTIKQYSASSVTIGTQFIFPFYIPSQNDITVYVTPPGQAPIPANDIQTLTANYTVTINADPITGGYIKFTSDSIPADGSIITLSRTILAELNVQFADARTFSGISLDDALDKLLLLIQQNQTYALDRNLSYKVNAELPRDTPSTISNFTQLDILLPGYIWMGSQNGVIAVELEENPDVSTLRSELENNQPGTDGSRLIGFYNTTPTTVHDELVSLDTQVATNTAAIAALENTFFTTGDIKFTIKVVSDTGWVLMNDGSIGSAASGATTRANADTLNLYTLIWNNVSDTWAPVSSGRGSSAAADFAANKTLTLPRTLGRALAAYGSGSGLSSRVLGQYLGEETHEMTIDELVSHNHTYINVTDGRGGVNSGGSSFWNANDPATTTNTGGGQPFNVMQPTVFLNVMIKL